MIIIYNIIMKQINLKDLLSNNKKYKIKKKIYRYLTTKMKMKMMMIWWDLIM